MTDEELMDLLVDLESDRVERKASVTDTEKICQAICAFANDMPNHQSAGVVFIGANDDGSCTRLPITDQLLRNLAHLRSDGNILPLPAMTVQKKTLNGCEMAVLIVQFSFAPPVRFRGQVWIRVGPRRAIASIDEERRLSEKRRSRDLPFDITAVLSATLEDLDLDLFAKLYLPSAIAPEVIAANNRTIEQQLSALRFATPIRPEPQKPTVLGMIVVGKDLIGWLAGAYIQFRRIDGLILTDPTKDQKEISGPLPELLKALDDVLQAHISVATDITSGRIEVQFPDYPLVALQQITRNAIMHRNYDGTNAPIRITWFSDRIEIQNPGGPFGQVTRENFGNAGITDYRNPHLAEALKNLGYVQRFGVGIALARQALKQNANPDLQYEVEDAHVLAILRRRP
ncbi:MAG TPA: ATP-binding protein [Candidatus Angelobacter sp.]|jgi:ATP-dependent DNA helicase RecG|nr:ATP-binding protein [Candidatus Angelobacter sp.]